MGNDMKTRCRWCHEPAIAATWTPRYGWIDLCQRHYIETSQEVVTFLRQKLEA